MDEKNTLQGILDRYYTGGYEDDFHQRSSTSFSPGRGSAAFQAATDLVGTIKKHTSIERLPTLSNILWLLQGEQRITTENIMQAVVLPSTPSQGNKEKREVPFIPTAPSEGGLSSQMREELIDLLLDIPGMEDNKTRTRLLADIPVEVCFYRADSLRADLARLVDALAVEAPLLLTFLDNLQAEEFPGEKKAAIERLYNEIEATDAIPDQPTLLERVLRALKSILVPRGANSRTPH